MRQVNTDDVEYETSKEIVEDGWIVARWDDAEGILEGIDSDLKEHGLCLETTNRGDDNWWIRIAEL